MRVLKFGGTSVGDAKRIARVSQIVREAMEQEPVVVTVSALGGVTNTLVELADASEQVANPQSLQDAITALARRHREVAQDCATDDDREALCSELDQLAADLERVVTGASMIKECTPRTRDQILSFGELASSRIVAAQLRRDGVAAQACNAQTLIVTDSRFGHAQVLAEPTKQRIRRHFADLATSSSPPVQVVTGFLAADRRGLPTTLGRGGSDYTAALLGNALEASCVEIWTDVDGVLSADPRRVSDAVSQPQLSFEELMELSHFGAKVIYPPTVQPLRTAGIPLYIRNTLRPEFTGTVVRDGLTASSHERPLAGVTSTGPVTLFRLEGPGMLGVPGIAARLFAALASRKISIILITQASSEHSISFATAPGCASAVCRCVHHEFANERREGALYDLLVDEDVCVVAAVGEGMAERPGVAARLFTALATAGVNVRSIAQGSSERNISSVVKLEDEPRALLAVHGAFFSRTAAPVSSTATASVVLAGLGGVGQAFLDILAAHLEPTDRCRLVAVANSRRILTAEPTSGLDFDSPSELANRLDADGRVTSTHDLLARTLHLRERGPVIFVDCTASAEVAGAHARLLGAGCNVVTANKLALAGDLETANAIRKASLGGGGIAFYGGEATVGAGLPVLRTLSDLITSGDHIERIEGVFSGTLGFVLHQLRSGVTLSGAVAEAKRRGYTEPDPWQDLGGLDVARKLLILARQVEPSTDLRDLMIKPLVDPPPQPGEVDLMPYLESRDQQFAGALKEAEAGGNSLAYLARWDRTSEEAMVGLQEVPAQHPAAVLSGTDNVFVFTTKRYPEGLVIRGPGAGVEVTAAAVWCDLMIALGHAGGAL